jgi:penicillin-binding protein 2
VQQVAEEALRGQRASAVAIDPSTGDILAFVSTPGFDPNLFARGLSRKEYLALTEDPDRPMYDRALRGVYPPGSTVKPLMALAALEAGVVTPHDTRFCRGQWRMPGVSRPWRDWKKEGHGTVDMRKALATSCDVYFYDMANLMGIDRMASFLSQFGLGALTGIDIPGEKAGILPSTDWKKRAFKRPEFQKWYPGDTISVGIGQGYMTATPLELAHATAILASRGERFRPRLVRAIRNAQTGAVRELPVTTLPRATTHEPDAWDYAIGGMIDVSNAPYGTARAAAAGSKYLIAGKSGTAQVFTVAASERMRKAAELAEHLRDHALFVAFAPADIPKPKIAVAVIVENAPSGGSASAAPVARRIIDAYLLTPEEWAEQEAKRQAAAEAKKAAQAATPAAPVGRE